MANRLSTLRQRASDGIEIQQLSAQFQADAGASYKLPAALLTATLQASLRTLAALPGSLTVLVGRLNEYACLQNQGGTGSPRRSSPSLSLPPDS